MGNESEDKEGDMHEGGGFVLKEGCSGMPWVVEAPPFAPWYCHWQAQSVAFQSAWCAPGVWNAKHEGREVEKFEALQQEVAKLKEQGLKRQDQLDQLDGKVVQLEDEFDRQQ